MHSELTQREQEVLDFIQKSQQKGTTPTVREIGEHLKISSPRSVSKHLDGLRQKGILANDPSQARSFRIISPIQKLIKEIAHIPLFGSIPAGFAETKMEEADGCVSVDINTLGVKPSPRLFALKVHGESMIGKHILNGDIVVIEHGRTPRNGEVVAALIDGESTLKTFVIEGRKTYLKAENPKFPKLFPSQQLVIQGVVATVIRNL